MVVTSQERKRLANPPSVFVLSCSQFPLPAFTGATHGSQCFLQLFSENEDQAPGSHHAISFPASLRVLSQCLLLPFGFLFSPKALILSLSREMQVSPEPRSRPPPTVVFPPALPVPSYSPSPGRLPLLLSTPTPLPVSQRSFLGNAVQLCLVPGEPQPGVPQQQGHTPPIPLQRETVERCTGHIKI